MILFTMTGHLFVRVKNLSHDRLSLLDPTSYLRCNIKMKSILWVGGISEWTKPESIAYFLHVERKHDGKRREREREKETRIDESSASFLPSFLPSAFDRRRSTLTADAYEADVKTFVKYEGTACGRSIRRAPSVDGATLRRERRGSHC